MPATPEGFPARAAFSSSRRKVRAASYSVASNITLVAGKCTVAFLTGSVSVLSEAVHSALDLVAALIAMFAVRFAAHPADREHPYGHGKIENVSGTVEAILIFVAAAFIVHEAVDKILHPHSIYLPVIGACVMGASALVNIVVSVHLQKVARETESTALSADAAHLRTDVYTSCAGMVGLATVAVTDIHVLDPLVALLVAVVILWEAWVVTRRSFRDLLDASLPAEETSAIEEILNRRKDQFQNWHALRTRKSGSERKIDLHLTLCRDQSVEESHALCDEIEREIEERVPGVDVMIHVEPCEKPYSKCFEEPCDGVHRPLDLVQGILNKWADRSVQFKDLHVHRGTGTPQVDVSLVVPEGMGVTEAHRICDDIEKEIRKAAPHLRTMIHIEPTRK